MSDELINDALMVHGPSLLAYFRRRLEFAHDAPDLLAKTFLVAWRRASEFPLDSHHQRLWLFVTARNVLANHQRGRRRHIQLQAKLSDAAMTSSEPDHEDHLAVRAAIAQLTPDHRELVLLHHWEGLSLAEAATVCGINASTARTRYAVARRQLKELLQVDASVG